MTNMVQVAVAGDLVEAEEIQTMLHAAGISSEVRQAVEVGQHVVVRRRHLARDFGVAPLVRIEQRISAEVERQRQDSGEEQHRQPDVGAEGETGARNREPGACGEGAEPAPSASGTP